MEEQEMNPVTEDEFSTVYRSSVEEIISRMPKDQSPFSKHNLGWHQDVFDAEKYLIDSEVRYRKVYSIFVENKCRRLLDVGGLFAAFPLAMSRLGFSVSIAEKFDYYGNALDEIANCLADNNIEIFDCDFTSPAEDPASYAKGKFDGISCMAVAEHLAHSPKPLMDNIYDAMETGGHLAFEVPNIAFWPNRFSFFFRGRTIHPKMETVYHSAIPFTGHHREYTIEDARYVLTESGFTIEKEDFFNYGLSEYDVVRQLYLLPARLFRRCAFIILLHSVKK